MRLVITSMAVAVGAIIFTIGCSVTALTATPTPAPTATPTPAQLIIGRWSQVNGSEVFRFFSSGDLDLSTPTLLGRSNLQGKYRFVGTSEIRVEINNLLGTTTALYELRFSGDRMTMRGANGAVTEYARAP